jgi:hypothetical protein
VLDNQIYYFEVGRGRWRGAFSFRITDRAAFDAAGLTTKERLLAQGMELTHRLTGDSRIDSTIWARPDEGVAGVAGNTVRISRFGITLYLLKETYTLDPDGSGVAVHCHERFGPIPFLFRNEKRHPAVIHADGMSSTYYIPLLGADWVADYTVHADRTHIDGVLSCPWARATETIHKLEPAPAGAAAASG